MIQKKFSQLKIGQKFYQTKNAKVTTTKIEPRASGMKRPCGQCGASHEEWNNAEDSWKMTFHFCPEDIVFIMG